GRRDPRGGGGAGLSRPRSERRARRSRGVHRGRPGRGSGAPGALAGRRARARAPVGRLSRRYRAVAGRGVRGGHAHRAGARRRLAERRLARLGSDEWLVVDGVLSDSPALSAHPRAVGVVKSHGAEYFEGPELERALTLPALHRTSVFRPKRRGARREIYSWYLRLWPWEGNDLLYGLLRVEARAHPGTVALAPRISAWLVGERAPLATPDRRWDRLLYPNYDV